MHALVDQRRAAHSMIERANGLVPYGREPEDHQQGDADIQPNRGRTGSVPRARNGLVDDRIIVSTDVSLLEQQGQCDFVGLNAVVPDNPGPACSNPSQSVGETGLRRQGRALRRRTKLHWRVASVGRPTVPVLAVHGRGAATAMNRHQPCSTTTNLHRSAYCNLEGKSPIFLVCEHAGRRIPRALGNHRASTSRTGARHIAWDIGAECRLAGTSPSGSMRR